MLVKTAELTGDALNWAVGLATGGKPQLNMVAHGRKWTGIWFTDDEYTRCPDYSTDRQKSAEISERCGISVIRVDDDYGTDSKGFTTSERIPVWCACFGQHSTTTSTEHQSHEEMFQIYASEVMYGPTPAIAAMRSYVVHELGLEVEVPDELIGDSSEAHALENADAAVKDSP
jgi:hypothetical protein